MVKESAKAKRKYVFSLVKMFREDLEAAFFSRYFRTRRSSPGLRKGWISTMQRTTFLPPPLLVLFLRPVLRDRPNGFLVSFMFARFALSDVLTELARCSRSSNENLLVNSWNSQR